MVMVRTEPRTRIHLHRENRIIAVVSHKARGGKKKLTPLFNHVSTILMEHALKNLDPQAKNLPYTSYHDAFTISK